MKKRKNKGLIQFAESQSKVMKWNPGNPKTLAKRNLKAMLEMDEHRKIKK